MTARLEDLTIRHGSDTQAGEATVAVRDAMGRLIAVLFTGDLAANVPRTVELDGRSLAPGVYVVTAEGYGILERLLVTRTR